MPDFRAETIYCLVVDRFDGDGAAPGTDWYQFWGGNLAGVTRRLDYLRAVGATAIWLTPIYDQIDGTHAMHGAKMAAYHGYWPRDFARIDRRFGTADDFAALLGGLRERGMKLVLEVVSSPSYPEGAIELFDGGNPTGIAADADEPAFRRHLVAAMLDWLDRGVDGLRIDTVQQMPLSYWQDFAAEVRGHRASTFLAGSWFQGGCYDAASVEFANAASITMLDFAWRTAVVECLAHRSGRGFEQVHAVVERDVAFLDPSTLVTFVDHHDLPRFLSLSGDPARFRLALLLTLVARGIPCVFYGNEQLLHEDTNRGNDPYNRPMMPGFEVTALARDVATLADLRRRNPAVQRGGMRRKWVDADRYVFVRAWLGAYLLVACNRSDRPASLGLTGVELPDGEYRDLLGGEAIVIEEGATRIEVPPRGIVVYAVDAPLPHGAVVVDVQVHGIRSEWGEELYLTGSAPELGEWDLDRAVRLEYVNQASWAGTLAFDGSVGAAIEYKFVVKERDGWRKEPGPVHRREVPRDGDGVIWRDDWRT